MSVSKFLGFGLNSSDAKEIKKITLNLTRPKNLAILTAGLGLSYVAYRTVITYLNRRKYRHIPGPPTKG